MEVPEHFFILEPELKGLIHVKEVPLKATLMALYTDLNLYIQQERNTFLLLYINNILLIRI